MEFGPGSLSARRAWIEITLISWPPRLKTESLSARRAWIEMPKIHPGTSTDHHVALRKESVDRNEGKLDADLWVMWSLSARRAWIEMLTSKRQSPPTMVALRKESVDRNNARLTNVVSLASRSPQGERG